MRLPPTLWDRLQEFCQRKCTGQVVLHIHEGVLTSYELKQVAKVLRWEKEHDDQAMTVTHMEKETGSASSMRDVRKS